MLVHNYPAPWVARHRVMKYARRDPVFLRARAQTLPFGWEDPGFIALTEPDQVLILKDAAQHGLKHGATIPLQGLSHFSASCSLVAETGPIDVGAVHRAIPYAFHAYHAGRRIAGPLDARPRITLARRERQCLELVALGKSDEEIGVILGIDKATAHFYVEKAKQRLNAKSRSQAVAYAIYTGAFNLEDVFGA